METMGYANFVAASGIENFRILSHGLWLIKYLNAVACQFVVYKFVKLLA
jgi:hypothetical protein